MNSANSRILFAGVSTMRDHAGQHKLYFIAVAFARMGIPVTVLVPDREENRGFFAGHSAVDARFYPAGSVLSDIVRKAGQLRAGNWSAVWVVGVGLRSFVCRWPGGRVPIVKDFDEFPSMIASFGPARRAYLRWIEGRMIAQADGFTCASAFLEEAVRRRRPLLGERLLRLPVAISEHEHRVDAALSTRLRESARGVPILLYIGSLVRFYEDQLDEILALAWELRRRRVPVLIRILGSGADAGYFEAKAARAGVTDTVEFAGHVERRDLASHMDAASVLIFPFAANAFNLSRCPTKAFHYAAANRPVVTNRTGEVAALLGDSALYYPERDVGAMADVCMQALQGRAKVGGIDFRSLTWNARARTFADWLRRRGWLPAPESAASTGAGSLIP